MPEMKLRHRLSAEQRFERVLKRTPEKNPVLPAVLHSIERYLGRVEDVSKLDTIVREVLAQHPEITREALKGWVQTWKALPAATRQMFVADELGELSLRQKLSTQQVRVAMERVVKPPQMQVVVQRTGWLSKLPHIHPISSVKITDMSPTEPDGFPWITLGEPFTVYGSGFSTTNEKNQIIIFHVVGGVAQPGVTVTPMSSQGDKLEAIAPIPAVMGAGDYEVYVEVQGKGGSNLFDAHFCEPTKAAATITSVLPASQYPGKTMVINGAQFAQAPLVYWRAIDPATGKGNQYYYPSTAARWESANQVTAVVPDWLVSFPGDYLIAVAGSNQSLSNWYPVTVRAYTYQVQFTQMKCIDESDPEMWGDDEIVTRWAIATSNQAWLKASSEYEGFEDGTVKSYSAADGAVFPVSGGTAKVIDYLLVMTTLYEWDEGDAKAATQFIGDLGKAIGSALWGSAVGEWIAKVIGYLEPLVVLFGGDPDLLGERTLKWTALELRTKTNNPLRSFTGKLNFLNDDDTGSYQLSYRVARGEGE